MTRGRSRVNEDTLELLLDLRDTGHITVRHPTSATTQTHLADMDTLKQVLVGHNNL